MAEKLAGDLGDRLCGARGGEKLAKFLRFAYNLAYARSGPWKARLDEIEAMDDTGTRTDNPWDRARGMLASELAAYYPSDDQGHPKPLGSHPSRGEVQAVWARAATDLLVCLSDLEVRATPYEGFLRGASRTLEVVRPDLAWWLARLEDS